MKVLFNFLGLFCVMVVCEEFNEKKTRTLKPTMVEKAKEYLKDDDITLQIVQKFFELNFNPELKALMHLSLTHLLVEVEIHSEVRNLGTHYRDIDRSLTGIRKI